MKQVSSWAAAAQHIRAQAADVFSFDIFDTLLLRKYHPDLVLARVAAWLDERQGKSEGTSLRTFHALYQKLAAEQERAGLDREVLGDALFTAWGGADTAALLDFYVSLETEALARNDRYHELLGELTARGDTVLIISDMYLPAQVIERLLANFGYQGRYGRLFVSSEMALLKRTGRLFDHVRATLGIAPKAYWIHSGDSQEADGRQAVAKGIKAVVNPHVHWVGGEAMPPKGATSGEAVYRALSRPCENFWESYGFYRLGPIFASYIHGLTSYAQEHQLSSLLFPAREGLFLKELYQAFLVDTGQPGPQGHYAYVSRAATLFYGGGADDYTFGCILQNGARTLRALVSNLLSADRIEALAVRMNTPPDQALSLDEAVALCRLLVADPEVSAAADEKHRATVGALDPYLASLGVYDGGAVGFVDVGWGAQIQYSLHRGLQQQARVRGVAAPDLHGLYMGLNAYALHRQDTQCHVTGLLCTEWNSAWPDTALMEFPAIAELACRAPHGTVLRLERTSTGESQPVFRSADTASRQSEIKDDPYLAHLQAGILAYLKGYAAVWRAHPFSFEETRDFALRMAERCVRHPAVEELAELGRLVNIADLGQDTQADLTTLWWHARQAHLPKAYRYAKLVAFAFHTQRNTAGLPAHRVTARKGTHSQLAMPANAIVAPASELAWQAKAEELRREPVSGKRLLKPVSSREMREVRRVGELATRASGLKRVLRRIKQSVIRR